MGNGCNGTTLLDPSTVFRMTKTDLVNQAKLSPTRFIFGSEISHGRLEMTRTMDSSSDPTTRLRMTGCWVLSL
jgi:hypothetical protein